jgi:hypothetical protein
MDQPMSQEELLEALAEQTRESVKFWKASQEFVPGGLLSSARKFKPYPFYVWWVGGSGQRRERGGREGSARNTFFGLKYPRQDSNLRPAGY